MATHRAPDLPTPPPFQRKIVLARGQATGLAVLCAIVLAAAAGLLGLEAGEMRASHDGLEVRVVYPRVLRYKTTLPLEIDVRNAGSGDMSRVEVRIERGYVQAFENVRFTPDAGRIDDRHYTVSLANLPVGETRKVVAWLEPNQRGRRHARLQVAADDRTPLELGWDTTVLP